MKTHHIPFLIILGTILFGRCEKNESIIFPDPPVQGNPFEIRAWDYAGNYFFVDTLYRPFYEPYYRNDPPIIYAATQVVIEEVWISRIGVVPHPNERRGVAILNLPPRSLQGYDSTLREQVDFVGEIENGLFIKLNRSEYEVVGQGYLGVVALRTAFSDHQIVAIAYQRADGTQFGEFSRDVGDTSVIVLKMVKPRNLGSFGPIFRVAWNQLLKNIYSVGHNVREVGFSLDIIGPSPSNATNQILGERLLRVLNLDHYNQDGTFSVTGDGQFDFRPGITVDPINGEIIIPSLRPFDDGIRRYFLDSELALPDSTYYSPQIYDTTKAFMQGSYGYTIRGRAYPF